MPHATLLVVPLTASRPDLADQTEAARSAGADMVELRVDLISDVAAVAEFLRRPRRLPVIVTVRAAAEGGGWRGDESARAALYRQLAAYSPEYVDVELAAWAGSSEFAAALAQPAGHPPDARLSTRTSSAHPPRLILSCHDLTATPADPAAALHPLLDSPADVVKAAFTARDALDSCRVLVELRRLAPLGRKIVLLAMGPAGVMTRVLAGKFGGFLTFAALEPGREAAAGQPTIRELLDTYRWRETGPATRVFGVVGWPVQHSRSPLLHNTAMRAAGIDGVYVPLPVNPDYAGFAGLADYITAHSELDIAGLSITVPHKEHALRWLTEHNLPVSELARRIGAVNTLVRTAAAAWRGENSDITGIAVALATVPDSAGPHDAAVLGAGGIARAAVAALLQRGDRVTIYNRTAARAEKLGRELGCAALPWEQRRSARHGLIINCTTCGMSPDTESTPLPAEALPAATIVMDTVYTPPETRLLREARQRGCRTIAGTEVFLAQAAAQFELWHGIPPPLELMRNLLASPT